MQRVTLIYLTSYLFLGGLGLLVFPDLALPLLLSNGSYGDVMPRVVCMFMVVLSGFIFQFVYRRDYRYYTYAAFARYFIFLVLMALRFTTSDRLFLLRYALVSV